MKVCTKCEEPKEPEEFHHTTVTRDGLHTRCKTCRGAADAALYQRQREARLAIAREDYAADPAKFIAKSSFAYHTRPEYREACKARAVARLPIAHAKRRANPVTYLADKLRSRIARAFRQRHANKGGHLWEVLGYGPDALHSHLSRYVGSPCEECGVAIIDIKSHIDHVVPLATAVTAADVLALNALANLRLICAPCNLHKGTREPS